MRVSPNAVSYPIALAVTFAFVMDEKRWQRKAEQT